MKLISTDYTSNMIAMCPFQIEKCQIVWSKDSTSEKDRQSIIKELKSMSFEIQEAVNFTKELSEIKMNEVKFWLSTESEIGYTLSIYYDVHTMAWGMMLEENKAKDNSPQVVGEIACTDPMTLSFIEPENILKTESLFE
jgi:type VI protein secretion system component VasA